MSICNHQWTMDNIQSGYLVVEGCHKCSARASFFSTEPRPPIDEYQDGEHFWAHYGDFQAVKFDLRCTECGEVQKLNDMMGLMLSTCDNPECEVHRLAHEGNSGAWIYVAMCADNTHASGKCVSQAGVKALNEYFNAQLSSSGKTIVVVPCVKSCSIDKCTGIVIADVGLTDIY